VPPDITVAVVNWNRRDYLRACLASLAGQRGAEFEVIVVDNGSRDGSVEMARSEFGARVIANAANLGFCAGNNQAFAAARGQFIALLNNDAEAAPDFLANLRRAFDAAPDIGMAAAKVLVWEDPRRIDRIDKVGHLIYPDGQNRGRGTGENDSGQYERVEECLWPDGCAAMYRKSMLDAIGGFDEDFFMFADDAELGLRADLAAVRLLPRVLRKRRQVRRQPGCGLAPAHLPDRAQSRAVGRQAVPVEPAPAESLLLRAAPRQRRRGGNWRKRRDGALPGLRQQTAPGVDHPARGPGRRAPAPARAPQTPSSAAHRQTYPR